MTPPSGKEGQGELFRRFADWDRQSRRAGKTSERFGYGLLLIGLAIALFGRYVPGGGQIPLWVGLGFLFPALACFVLSILARLRWKRENPFKG